MISSISGLEYLAPNASIGIMVLILGIFFTTVIFYFVFLKLGAENYSLEEKNRAMHKKREREEKIARLYPRD